MQCLIDQYSIHQKIGGKQCCDSCQTEQIFMSFHFFYKCHKCVNLCLIVFQNTISEIVDPDIFSKRKIMCCPVIIIDFPVLLCQLLFSRIAVVVGLSRNPHCDKHMSNQRHEDHRT